jgi:DNA-binding NtrC family response regulator
MPLDLQVKLLRVLETGSFVARRHHRGDHDRRAHHRGRPTAAREKALAEGKFREDLYHRPQRLPDHAAAAARTGFDARGCWRRKFLREIQPAPRPPHKTFSPEALARCTR